MPEKKASRPDPRDSRAPGYDPRKDPTKPEYDARFDPQSAAFEPRYHPEDPTRHQHAPARVGRDQGTSDEARESAKRGVTGEKGDYPKPMVRLVRGANGWSCELQMVDKDGEQTATDGGWQAIELPAGGADFVQYPKWKYHADGRQQVVHTKEAEDKLEGYEDVPPEPEQEEGDRWRTGEVPPPSAATLPAGAPNRPPVPPDRG